MKKEKSLEDRFLDCLDGFECYCCNEVKEDVEYRENPFSAEIHDDHTKHYICNDCIVYMYDL